MAEQKIIEAISNLKEDKIKEILLYKGKEQEFLFEVARKIREKSKFQNKVELRSVIELSNICFETKI